MKINMKLLVKEIKSKAGELHFRRWRLLQLPFFAIYIHGIYKSDEDLHPHSHPWSFISFILKGAYTEQVWFHGDWLHWRLTRKAYDKIYVYRRKFSIVGHTTQSYHKIKIDHGPIYSLVLTFGFKKNWRYLVDDFGIEQKYYRKLKNSGQL